MKLRKYKVEVSRYTCGLAIPGDFNSVLDLTANKHRDLNATHNKSAKQMSLPFMQPNVLYDSWRNPFRFYKLKHNLQGETFLVIF